MITDREEWEFQKLCSLEDILHYIAVCRGEFAWQKSSANFGVTRDIHDDSPINAATKCLELEVHRRVMSRFERLEVLIRNGMKKPE